MPSWIKSRVDLWDDPRTVRLERLLGVPRAAAYGALHRLWSIAFQYTQDGVLVGYDAAALDAAVGIPGFADALQSVGWLEVHDDRIVIPRFEEHMSTESVKRSQAAERQARRRQRRGNIPPKTGARHAPSVTRALPDEDEERDEESECIDLKDSGGGAGGGREHRARLAVRLLRPKSNADVRVILQAAALADEWSENWFHDALEAIRKVETQPDNPMAYWRTCLENMAREPPISADFETARQAIRVSADEVRQYREGRP